MLTMKELRTKRIAGEISASLLAAKAEINRSRLSALECGHADPKEHELRILSITLDFLINARSVVQKAADSVGWPMETRH